MLREKRIAPFEILAGDEKAASYESALRSLAVVVAEVPYHLVIFAVLDRALVSGENKIFKYLLLLLVKLAAVENLFGQDPHFFLKIGDPQLFQLRVQILPIKIGMGAQENIRVGKRAPTGTGMNKVLIVVAGHIEIKVLVA